MVFWCKALTRFSLAFQFCIKYILCKQKKTRSKFHTNKNKQSHSKSDNLNDWCIPLFKFWFFFKNVWNGSMAIKCTIPQQKKNVFMDKIILWIVSFGSRPLEWWQCFCLFVKNPFHQLTVVLLSLNSHFHCKYYRIWSYDIVRRKIQTTATEVWKRDRQTEQELNPFILWQFLTKSGHCLRWCMWLLLQTETENIDKQIFCSVFFLQKNRVFAVDNLFHIWVSHK